MSSQGLEILAGKVYGQFDAFAGEKHSGPAVEEPSQKSPEPALSWVRCDAGASSGCGIDSGPVQGSFVSLQNMTDFQYGPKTLRSLRRSSSAPLK